MKISPMNISQFQLFFNQCQLRLFNVNGNFNVNGTCNNIAHVYCVSHKYSSIPFQYSMQQWSPWIWWMTLALMLKCMHNKLSNHSLKAYNIVNSLLLLPLDLKDFYGTYIPLPLRLWWLEVSFFMHFVVPCRKGVFISVH